MAVTVEFLGMARMRAGCVSLDVEAASLGAALQHLTLQLPALKGEVIDQGHLAKSYIASVNGRAFVRDPATPLKDGDRLLILTADVGG